TQRWRHRAARIPARLFRYSVLSEERESVQRSPGYVHRRTHLRFQYEVRCAMQSRYKFISALVMVGFLTVAVRAQQGINPIDVQPIDVQPIEIQPVGIASAVQPDPPAGPVNLI